MVDRSLLVIVLAAGMGTRMKSDTPKVLHDIGGKSMLAHVLSVADYLGAEKTAVVIGPDMEGVADEAKTYGKDVEIFVQQDRLGTAHAVLAARKAIAGFKGDILVLYGDTPLITAPTLRKLRQTIDKGHYMAVLGFEAANPTGYGRLLTEEDGQLKAIREENDATPEEKAVTFCNSGVFCFKAQGLAGLLDQISKNNSKGEYYLTDAIQLARREGLTAGTVTCDESEVLGVNSRAQLAEAEQILQIRLRKAAMEGGATLLSPDSVYLCVDTKLGNDVVIEPNVFFGPGVTVGNNVTIKGFSHLEGATLDDNVTIGPFARLRPGTTIASEARVGNFVEIKNSAINSGAKVNHLTYIGDAIVGSRANIGAGTITCNYDGFAKHRTEIGANAFIGSNSALVAPVKVGDRAYIGSGSVITQDVEADSLAMTRSPQIDRPGWAEKFRSIQRAGRVTQK